jgi:tetratricopeptide (TPR) repeat protein
VRRPPCLGVLAAALLLAGCGRISDYARVAEGNRLYDRGDYQRAIVAYLGEGGEARGSAAAGRVKVPSDAPAAAATIDYDLANVYARLGEYPAATERYAAARRRGNEAIVADSFFNEGVALFERGGYEESWKAFRSALRLLKSGSKEAEEARRDLELAWRAWKKSSQSPPPLGLAGTSIVSGAEGESEQRLLRRLETGRWRPGAAPLAGPTASDY